MDAWASGDQYDRYMGRWSRLVAAEFLMWLDVRRGVRWLDVGCGTGVLTTAVLQRCDPASVVGVDPSAQFVAYAAAHVPDGRASFRVGDAQALPVDDATVDAVVSGLVLNFVPEPGTAVREMCRASARGAVVAAYVWDYGDMQPLRYFWDAAVELDPAARASHEQVRFDLCRRERLQELFDIADLADAEVRDVVVPTVFPHFEAYWTPFLGGTGPAPAYTMSLSEDARAQLRKALRARLPIDADGAIRLTARAWAVRGTLA